ncbi:LLM class flavin-dependent oxidoreductase [Saccharothrix lopnurensis]|uniref:LLM class flavin-dependent oxidoreductase n=1 Tax=Saccharothrix lopnurensis TaxID=1670621 RepID=A0ABW1P5Y7_9PSEU
MRAGLGDFGLLAQYGIDWAKTKPLSRLKEAHHVLRILLDEGAIDHEGEFYRYRGLFTFARPVQRHVPVKLGAMRGPKSFQVAGEVAGGVHHALSYTRSAYEYVVENVRIGAERAGRDVSTPDLGAWVVFATGPDGRAAKDAARAVVGLYASSMPAERLARNGVDPASLTDIIAAVGEGRVDRAFELTPPELAGRLSVAGTPQECVAKIRSEIAPAGVDHLILAITDAALVKAFTGLDLPGVATMREQLRLVHDHVMPATGRARPRATRPALPTPGYGCCATCRWNSPTACSSASHPLWVRLPELSSTYTSDVVGPSCPHVYRPNGCGHEPPHDEVTTAVRRIRQRARSQRGRRNVA